jgi:hypothetical protein
MNIFSTGMNDLGSKLIDAGYAASVHNRTEWYSYCVIFPFRPYFLLCRQQGHRGKLLTSATVRRRRIEAIECGTWRSGRMGGAARLEISG